MTHLRACELVCGVLTGLSGLVSFVALWAIQSARGVPSPSFFTVALGALIWLAPPSALALGAYAHARRRKTWGKTLVWAGGALSVLMLGFLFFGGILYYGVGVGLTAMAPGMSALLTMLCTLAASDEKETR